MKNILKFSLIVLVALTTFNTYAVDGGIPVKVLTSSSTKEIRFAVNQVQKANVTITDKFHNVIYSEVVTGKDGIIKTYNLEEFPVGTYYLEIETNAKKATHAIVITRDASTLSRTSVANL